MTSLSQAQTLADAIDTAKQQFEAYIRPVLQDYINFIPERDNSWEQVKFTDAEKYSFTEVDSTFFIFESEEYYQYGEYEKDCVELPFAFVEDPEAFKTKDREVRAEKARKSTEAQRKQAQDEVIRLEAQLEAAKKRAVLASVKSALNGDK